MTMRIAFHRAYNENLGKLVSRSQPPLANCFLLILIAEIGMASL